MFDASVEDIENPYQEPEDVDALEEVEDALLGADSDFRRDELLGDGTEEDLEERLADDYRREELMGGSVMGGQEEFNGGGDWIVEQGPVESGGDEEIVGGDEEIVGDAVLATLEVARDSRQPPPRMRARLPEEERQDFEGAEEMVDIFLGAAAAAGRDQFPIAASLLQRAGGGMIEPRYVLVTTEADYERLRESGSPALADFRARLAALEESFREHAGDPDAHGRLDVDLEDVRVAGDQAEIEEDEKRVDMYLPKWAEGKVRLWRQGDLVCASIALPGSDGELRVCTSIEPLARAISEMSRYATQAGARAEVIGALPAMGAVLGAGTIVKEMAAAAPDVLARPEARGSDPFLVRIEPRAKPALAAMIALAILVRRGDPAARDEWCRLAEMARKGGADAVGRAMLEAVEATKKVK